MKNALIETEPEGLVPVTDPTPEALKEHLLQVYEESGFGEIIPIDELRTGFDDILADAAVLLGELMRAARKSVPLARVVVDTENFPHLSRVHGYATDVMRAEVPQELDGWIRRLHALGESDPTRFTRIGQIAFAMMVNGHAANRMLGRFVVFELLCVGLRLTNDWTRDPSLGPRPFECETPTEFVEHLAEHELDTMLQSPDYQRELGVLSDPFVPPTAMMKVLFDTHHDELAEALCFISKEQGELLERRQRLVEVMHSLPPAEAVLFRRNYAKAMGEQSKPSYAQLRRRHPVLLADTTDAALAQRTKRCRESWEKLLTLEPTDELKPWQGVTLSTVLARIEEED